MKYILIIYLKKLNYLNKKIILKSINKRNNLILDKNTTISNIINRLIIIKWYYKVDYGVISRNGGTSMKYKEVYNIRYYGEQVVFRIY